MLHLHSAQSNCAEAKAVFQAGADDALYCVAQEWRLSLELRDQGRVVELDACGHVLLFVEALWLHARLAQVCEHREYEGWCYANVKSTAFGPSR